MPTLDQLPEELLHLIGRYIYDPLETTPIGRPRCHSLRPCVLDPALGAEGWGWYEAWEPEYEAKPRLFHFAATCRAARRAVRPLMFGHIRVASVAEARAVAEAEWAVYVRALFVNLFEMTKDQPRSCWDESALLARMINAVPQLQHLSIAANQSDNTTLALLFASLIPRDGHLPPAHPIDIGVSKSVSTPTTPFIERLISFEWLEEIDWDDSDVDWETGYEPLRIPRTPVFVSTHHLIRHARNLEFLNFDVSAGVMEARDVLAVVGEVASRAKQTAKPLKLCFQGQMHRDTDLSDFRKLVSLLAQCNLKELYMECYPREHQPIPPSDRYRDLVADEFLELFRPLASNREMSILEIATERDRDDEEVLLKIVTEFAGLMPNLIAMGLSLCKEEWRGVWRGQRDQIDIRPLQEGDITQLAVSARAARLP